MIECFICHCEVSDTLPDYFMHLKLQHGRSGQYDTYCCSQGQCCRTFSNKYTFTQHLRKHHQDEFSYQRHSVLAVEDAACNAEYNYSCDMETENDTDVCDRDNCAGVTPEHNSTSKDIKQLAAAFIAELKGCISTLSTVNRVVISCRQLFESMVDDIAVTLDSAGVTCDEVGSKLDIYRNPFANLETEYAQTTYMESIGAFVRPETYIVGNRQTFQVDNTANLKKPVMENVTAQCVPLTKMIVALNDKTDLIRCALQGVTENDGCFRSYFDGSVWNDLALTNQPTLVLRLYGDDFEPCNPLGSRKTVYKIGCIYYQIENLPSYLLSKTENIFLATCYHSDDVKYFGWEAILRPLVNELKALETTGITLVVNGETMHVKVIVGVFTADNLFMNSIMGFVESFTANKPCRECTLHRHDFQKGFVEDKSLVRTVESYDYAVETVNVQETGIKQKCVLNELRFFHVATNCSHDVMHDVFEGVLAYDMLLILTALIKAGYFMLEVLNHRVQTFSYGYHDAGSKPPTIFLPAEMLPFDASQTFCLMRIMALAVGDLVPEDDAIWQFYLTLRQLMDIVLSPSISEMQVQALSVLVSEYLESHLTLFPCHTLKNKHHHLIHFPSLIRKIGPLIRYSCMRFESKHQRSKKLLHIAGNFKNALKSCAFRHQHDVAFRLLKASTDEGFDIVIGNGSVVTISQLQDSFEINHCLGNVGMYCEFYAAKWVEVRGIKYKPSVVVHCGTEHENTPVFLEVQHILVRQSNGSSPNISFVGHKLNTLYFNSHFHSWCVERPIPHEIASFDPTALLYCTPLTVSRQLYHGDRVELVSVRYHV